MDDLCQCIWLHAATAFHFVQIGHGVWMYLVYSCLTRLAKQLAHLPFVIVYMFVFSEDRKATLYYS